MFREENQTSSPPSIAYVGCAGWAIRSEYSRSFPSTGTHLERYAREFSAVEINSSFYGPHRGATYARWAKSTPDAFRFAVKAPKSITHDSRLRGVEDRLASFLDEVSNLETKLGPLLFQFPRGFIFDQRVFEAAFEFLRNRFGGAVTYEPRDPSWLQPAALERAKCFALSLVHADPPGTASFPISLDDSDLLYFRLHGSPHMYYSRYSAERLAGVAERIRSATNRGVATWCIFDNTASGEALRNAFELKELLSRNVADVRRS